MHCPSDGEPLGPAAPATHPPGVTPARLVRTPGGTSASGMEATCVAEAAATPDRVLLGRYQLKRVIGEGGFGAVYEAQDKKLRKRVAVKLLAKGLAGTPEALARFHREAIAASQIGHKGIVDVTDFDRDVDGTPFIVMEYIEGVELAALLSREGALAVPRVLVIGIQAAQSLEAAHRAGILHRDLKPANVFLSAAGAVQDFVKIVDFGISKVLGSDTARLTSTGMMMGTPYYMSPEQGQGQEVDARTDIYALGVMLYEMLVGGPPFRGDTPLAVVTQHLFKEPTPPSQANPQAGIPPEADAIVLRAMAKTPEARYPTMAELGDALLELLARLDPAAAHAFASPSRSTPPGVSASLAVARSVATPAPVPAVAESAAAPATPAPRRWPLFLAIGLALAAAAMAALVFLRPTRSPADPPTIVKGTPSLPSGALLPPASPPPGSADPTPAAPRSTVRIELAIHPPDARVELNGVRTTENPLELARGESFALRISAEGHKTHEQELRAATSGVVEIRLERAAPAPSRGREKRSTGEDLIDRSDL